MLCICARGILGEQLCKRINQQLLIQIESFWVFLQTENKCQPLRVSIKRISILNLQDLRSCSKVDWPKECKRRKPETATLKLSAAKNSSNILEHDPSKKCIFGLFRQLFTRYPLKWNGVVQIAELVLSEYCTIGFSCCQKKRRGQISFLEGKRSVCKNCLFCRENGLLKETKSELEHAIAETERPLRYRKKIIKNTTFLWSLTSPCCQDQ